ncbi:hypothetical protein Q7A53_05335 [Halobacillus rhizosphaerae]|uniref:hypothetical protein n=1 Tax=Halobacillus rhizosphaerae TaxID=3064889 RepID=UPI00398AD4B7
MANNDERILLLKKQIAEKKKNIGILTRFSPVTNCSLELDGVRFNLNALDKEKLQHLLIKLHTYFLSSKFLKMENEVEYSGYKLDEWITDITSKLDILYKKDEIKKMKAMETKLSELLSDGKKVELEIDEIESLLKGE